MTARSFPEDGDIVVRKELRDDGITFVLLTAPGVDQFLVRTRDAALMQARNFAKRQRVRVWLADDDHAFALVEDFRRKQN